MKEDFEIGQPVRLARSQEAGEIIGRAEYARRPPAYLVEYLAGDGRQVDAWFDREALVAD